MILTGRTDDPVLYGIEGKVGLLLENRHRVWLDSKPSGPFSHTSLSRVTLDLRRHQTSNRRVSPSLPPNRIHTPHPTGSKRGEEEELIELARECYYSLICNFSIFCGVFLNVLGRDSG